VIQPKNVECLTRHELSCPDNWALYSGRGGAISYKIHTLHG